MRVKAKYMLFYNNKRYKEGHEFDLIEIKGKKMDSKGNLVDHVWSPKDQFSEKSMINLEGSLEAVKAKPVGRSKKTNLASTLDVI